MRIFRFRAGVFVLVFWGLLIWGSWSGASAQITNEPPFGLEKRIPWNSSRVVGSPEPPLPFVVERIFPKIKWETPLFAIAEPGSDWLMVVLQGGEKNRPSRIVRIKDDPATTETIPFLTISNRLVYSVEFHPGYATNGQLFVFTNGPTPDRDRTNRVSRFAVSRIGARECNPDSEQVIIEWRSGGHDGGGMGFGRDGMFYISTGDGTSDSDAWDSGQTLNDLLGSVLRIDLNRQTDGKLYSIPSDNPFLNIKDARGEIWAYGLRNPWRLAADEKTGQVWVGNNGQDLWETVHLVRRGENYGWSVYEGSHPFYLNRRRGPTPLVPPTVEHHHFEMRSLTGGVVYYGEQFPELNGAYIYGDYSTGKILGVRHDGKQVVWRKDLAESALQITAFTRDHHGGLIVVDGGGGLYRLVRAPRQTAPTKFPTRLSQTGLFASTAHHQVQAGVIPYTVNAPGWFDGAEAERFIGLPGDAQIEYASSGGWNFNTNGAVLAQTLSLAMEHGNPASRRRIETRLLTRQNGQWYGYSYRWDARQKDASLVPSNGAETEFKIKDTSVPGGIRRQTWRFPSRSECMACHSRAANFVLGLSEAQMNKTHAYGPIQDNQLRTWQHIGLLKGKLSKPPGELTRLSNPSDTQEPLEKRARSYLHANCSVCHVEAGGGNSKMELGFNTRLERMNLIGARPQHDTFGIQNAMLIAPGEPDRSVLMQRISRRGRGQMPPLVSTVIDSEAAALIRSWIVSMEQKQQFVREWSLEDLLPALAKLDQERSFENGKAAYNKTGCAQCHRFGEEGGSVGPDLTGVSKRLAPCELLESIIFPSKTITEGYASIEIETKDGEAVSGRIEREDKNQVVLRLLATSDETVTVKKSEIRQRKVSSFSNMPVGMLNTLTESEILDLLAYLRQPEQAEK